MGKGQRNRGASRNRRVKRHMQKNLGFSTFSERIKKSLKSAKPAPVDLDVDPLNEEQ